VFNLLNQERARDGRPALRWSGVLATSAARHNQLQDRNGMLSHQFSGEASLMSRESAAGFHGSYAAENVGESGQLDEQGALALQQAFYDDPAHRDNIDSTSGRYVGISVIIDSSSGELWVTEDFGG
jgi:uncharacterized protein YkwD